jgi:hypothetical protein
MEGELGVALVADAQHLLWLDDLVEERSVGGPLGDQALMRRMGNATKCPCASRVATLADERVSMRRSSIAPS